MSSIFVSITIIIANLVILTIVQIGCQVILTPQQFHIGSTPNQIYCLPFEKCINRGAILSISFSKEFDDKNNILNKTIEFIDDDNLAKAYFNLKNKDFENFKISHNNNNNNDNNHKLILPKKTYMKINFKDTNEFTFDGNFNLTYDSIIYFQTDRPIYRPNDIVKFRILEINRNSQPKSDNCNLTIKNHQKVKLDFTKIELKPPYYFGQYEFQLPQRVKEGIWRAEIFCNHGYDRLNFEIKNYKKPILRIDIVSPNIHYCSAKNLNIAINATYTWGKPVNGFVFLELYTNKPYKLLYSEKDISLEHGSMNRSISITELPCKIRYNLPINLYVKAVVTDISTNAKEESKSNSILLTSTPFKISYKYTNIYYHTNISNFIVIDVTDFNDLPVENIPMKIIILDRRGNEISTFSTTNDKIVKTDKNGLAIVTFKLNKSIGRLTVEAKTIDPRFEYHDQAYVDFIMRPFEMNGNSAISLNNRKQIFYEAGQNYNSRIDFVGNVNKQSLYWIVLSKGFIFHSGKLNSTEINLSITNRMAPNIRIFIFAMADNNEIIADSLFLNVQQKKCGVQIELDSKDTFFEPGSEVKFNFDGKHHDVVAMNAVDESIYLLRQINERERFQRLLSFNDIGSGPGGGRNSLSIIDSTGFKVLEKKKNRNRRSAPECLMHDHSCCYMALLPSPKSCYERSLIIKKYLRMNVTLTNFSQCFIDCCRCKWDDGLQTSSVNRWIDASKSNRPLNLPSSIPTQTELKIDEKNTRYDFRDSWLFDLILLNASSNTYSKRAPHSTTSWIISSVSLSQKDGFCLAENKRIKTFKPFFIHLSMPEFLLLNEHAEIKATIFNYLDENLNVNLYLYKNDEICSEASSRLENSKTSLNIIKQSSMTKTYPIIPIRVGTFTIKLKAATIYRGEYYPDIILKNITINFPGQTVEEITPLDLDPGNRAKRAATKQIILTKHSTNITNQVFPDQKLQKIDILFQKNLNKMDNQLIIIPETVQNELYLIGSKFNPTIKTIEELDHLIKKPKGCGEQNMYYMAFNLYTINYLNKIGKLKEKTEKRAKNYLVRALRQQLDFRKDDGSFSAFINREPSVWLTAFISKVFCQSVPYLSQYIDNNVILHAIRWLLKQQSSDGHWDEIFPVLHAEALGGTNQGRHTLTAYILIALNECKNYIQNNNIVFEIENLDNNINRALKYLSERIHIINHDSYSLSIITYSFVLSKSRQLDAYRLIEKLLSNPDKRLDESSNYYYYNNNYSIETTAYVLLSLIKNNVNNEIVDSLANYLTLQQKDGAFDNTQNTIVALEALAEFYSKKINSQNDNDYYTYQLLTNISFDSRPKRSIQFTNDNIDLLHSVNVENNIDKVDIVTLGNGHGKFELITTYNIINPEQLLCKFELNIKIDDYYLNAIENPAIDLEKYFSDAKQVFQEQEINNSDFARLKNRRYTKRSLWTKLRDQLRGKNDQTTQISEQHQYQNDSKEKRSTNECSRFERPSDIDIENPTILILTINFRKLINKNEGMYILEIGLLSGFKVIESDIEKLKQKHEDNIYHYFIGDTKIEFYLKSVPFGRMESYCFRIYQKNHVRNSQGALINIYGYYEKNARCSKLYQNHNEMRIHKCDKKVIPTDVCDCQTSKICPQKLDEEIKMAYYQDVHSAFEFYEKIFCKKFSAIIEGIVEDTEKDHKNHRHLITMKNLNIIKKDKVHDWSNYDQFYLEDSCHLNLEKNYKIILIVPHSDSTDFYPNGIRLIDGRSILEVFYEDYENSRWLEDLNSMISTRLCPLN